MFGPGSRVSPVLVDDVDLVGDVFAQVHSIKVHAAWLSGLIKNMAVLKKRAILAVSSRKQNRHATAERRKSRKFLCHIGEFSWL